MGLIDPPSWASVDHHWTTYPYLEQLVRVTSNRDLYGKKDLKELGYAGPRYLSTPLKPAK